MAVVIESSVWEPSLWLYSLIFSATFFSIALLSHLSKKHSTLAGRTPTLFDHGISTSFIRFQKNFLHVYHLVSVLENSRSVFGEFEFTYYGVRKDHILLFLCVGHAASLICGSVLGVFSDIIGQKKVCLVFCILHVFNGVWKRIAAHPSSLASTIFSSLSASIFSFSFETWMVIQHDEQGHRRDTLNDIFWFMSVSESMSMMEGQVLSNWLIGDNVEKNISSPFIVAVVLAIIGIIYITKGWPEVSQKATPKEYKMSFRKHIFGEKKILLLAWAQACLHFSTLVFWIFWAPTVEADGREVDLGKIFACLVGSRILGSTIFPWLMGGISSVRAEECMVYAFSILGVILSITAYDYQEVGVLLALFCLFHAAVGFISPSLAKLRTLYVPNQLRGGMISLSHAPAHAAMLFFLVQRGYNRNISNATIFSVAAFGVFTAAYCMHMLRRLGKQPYQNGPKL